MQSVKNEDFDFHVQHRLTVKLTKEYTGLLDYNKLVRIRSLLKYQCTDVIRLLSFKRETIEQAIFLQDILDSKVRGDKTIKSYFLKQRNPANFSSKVIISIRKCYCRLMRHF
jgi:hypothetical protein